jgi:hypothetical protein
MYGNGVLTGMLKITINIHQPLIRKVLMRVKQKLGVEAHGTHGLYIADLLLEM